MKQIDSSIISSLTAKAVDSPRKRSHHNIHDDLQEDLQRLLIAMQPGTYIRPHRHPEEYKKETIVLLQGSCFCITFSDDGDTLSTAVLTPSNPICEFPDRVFHSLICLEKDTAILEFKRGPYEPLLPDSFALWAPEEGDPETLNWQKKVLDEAGIS